MFDVVHKPKKRCSFVSLDVKNDGLGKFSVVLNDEDKEEIKVNIQGTKSRVKSELMELWLGKRKRVYLAYGIADIDIYKIDGNYHIMNSPNEGLYLYYELTEEEFLKLIDSL